MNLVIQFESDEHWWLKDQDQKYIRDKYILGAEELETIKEHFKNILLIDNNEKVTIIDKEELTRNLLFI